MQNLLGMLLNYVGTALEAVRLFFIIKNIE